MIDIKVLKDNGGVDITNMNADFTTKWYNVGKNLHPAIQLGWDADMVGTFYFDVSIRDSGDNVGDVDMYTTKNAVSIIATDRDLLILESNLSIRSFRLRWVRTSGTANLVGGALLKTNWA